MLVVAPPVPGPIVRPFAYAGSPFRAGLHRGIDLRSHPGQPVAAPCSGRVVYAGRFGVTRRCGSFRVTLQGVRDGRATGRRVHLGVRRAGDPVGYVDPAPLLREPVPDAPTAPPVRSPRLPPARPRAAPSGRAAPLAPWPAWLGLTALLGAVRLRRRVVVSNARWPSTSPRRSST